MAASAAAVDTDNALPDPGTSLIEAVPSDILRTILYEHIGKHDLTSLFRLAACSKTLARRIYEEASCLWDQIEFENVKHSDQLTDDALSVLLQRINAREVTTSLSLQTCTQIVGTGLEPLRGSRALLKIDLCVHGERDGVSPTPSFNITHKILSTMPPFVGTGDGGLKILKAPLDLVSLDSFCTIRNPLKDQLIRSFRTSLAIHMAFKRTKCHHCNHVVMDKIPSCEEFSSKASKLICYECKNVTCTEGECPDMMECMYCYDQLCTQCAGAEICDCCGNVSCPKCPYSNTLCKLCKVSSCGNGDCLYVWHCGKCSENFRGRCVEFSWCELCHQAVCAQCRLDDACEECGERLVPI